MKISKKMKVGDVVQFGHQSRRSIEWIVLDVRKQDGRALLLSKYGLERRRYNEEWVPVTWEECTLRKYLQEEFINTHFMEEEQRRIRSVHNHNGDNTEFKTPGGNPTWDRVFLLSLEEYERYFGNSQSLVYQERECTGVWREEGTRPRVWWWLRSPGSSEYDASDVSSGGSLDAHGGDVCIGLGCVRPALFVNLES